jgi:type II secretory pathway component GspD/PulD (secretin)
MRFVPQTGSILFAGNQEGLDKVQSLLGEIDTSTALGAIRRMGNLTFLLYKIQYASGDKLVLSLKAFAQEIKQTNAQDKQLADALSGVKWVKETNSLLFTGDNNTLEQIDLIVKKFDIPSLAGPQPVERAAPTFVIYNPKYISGDELISILCDFMQNLMASGVSDPGLFDAINNLKWLPKTSSLLVSGEQQSVDKVQQLLTKFDIPGKENANPSIESIDNTSFLVYKLQYHAGDDILTALKQVALSLGKGTSSPTALVDAINAMQWIQVTNSLLCSGQQDILVKLKDLIQNLDVPLRQVFIEVLVIQTSLLNTQDFGLMWGGQAQYFNKATLGTGNFPLSATQGSSTPTSTFPTTLQGINATTTPKGGNVPFTTGFDLGVIGDIIMHKGRSFISLGALINAIQLDTDSTVLLNPKIITQDNRQSTVFIGQNVPYTGSLITNTSQNSVQTANIEYRDVGVSLTITPILGDNDIITLDIVNDISQVINNINGNATTSNTQVTGIQTSHAHMETRVHVQDNYFVALSGMINDSKTHFKTGIPCLGGLPVIGMFFSETDRTATKSNIIIFVRPQIVKTYGQYKQITEHQEWLYKDNARLPVLKEEFDEGIDLVKLPENE